MGRYWFVPVLVWTACADGALDGSLWRVYRAEGGLGETFVLSVNVSPRGNVWVRHPMGGGVSWLDGYQVRTLDGLEDVRFPVYESRIGQIWSLYQDGLLEYQRGRWVRFPVESIRMEHQATPSRLLRSIPLLPVERDHLLVLLPRQLSKHNPGLSHTLILRRADETKIGSFIELIEARDGGGWLSGSRGLAKLPGPIRRLTSESVWEEHPVPAEWGCDVVGRPFEDDEGLIMVTGERLDTGERLVLEFDGERWSQSIGAPEGTRNAWRTEGGTLWVQARGALYRKVEGRWQNVEIPGMTRLQVLDVAVEPQGVFWLATADGLVRHAPTIWRKPGGAHVGPEDAIAIEEDDRGGLWLGARGGLYGWVEDRIVRLDWPDGFELREGAGRPIQRIGNGRLAVCGGDGMWMFDPETGTFDAVRHLDGRRFLGLLGQGPDETIVLLTGDAESGEVWLEMFDGDRLGRPIRIPEEMQDEGVVRFALSESRDRMWLGTDRGIWQWHAAQQRFELVPGVPVGAYGAVAVGPRGTIWVGGEGRLVEFDGRSWRVVQTGMGTIRALHRARDGILWAAISGGVGCYVDGSWVEHGTGEGMPSAGAWDVMQDRLGQLWAVTAEGLYRHHPESDVDEPRSYFVTEQTPREVSTLRPVTLAYGGRDRWEYTQRERLLFSYRLNEGAWSSYGAVTEVTYLDLPAGRHRLAVRAMDRNRNEESDPAVWEFVAFVPWYAEVRLLAMAAGSALVVGFLGWLAVNRHLRLMRSHAEVEGIVAERTRELELANRELLHSHKMRALGTLAAGIAHDFNNILSIIKGSAQVIQDHPEDQEKIRMRLSRIETMVEQGSGIIRTMLGFSRASDWKKRECNVNDVVQEAARLMTEQLGPDVRVESRIDGDPPTACGVPELIRQMLLNLMYNAADAMDGRGTIVLETGRLEQLAEDLVLVPMKSDEYVTIAVRDSGHGIAPEILPRIFEPFYSTKALSTRRGTGLGLTMVYAISKELGLGLRVESGSGQGARFTLILAAARA